MSYPGDVIYDVVDDVGGAQNVAPFASAPVIADTGPEVSRGSFRINAKGFFLTYPRCTLEPHILLGRIGHAFANLDWAVVSREHHADGGLHLHAGIMLKARRDVRDMRLFDELAGQHGNYLAMRSVHGSLAYLNKEGFEVWRIDRFTCPM